MGRGAGGLVLKPLAGMHPIYDFAFRLSLLALFGLAGYTLHGAYKEIQKHFVAGPNCVHLARTVQGFEELKAVSEAVRREILQRWSEIQS